MSQKSLQVNYFFVSESLSRQNINVESIELFCTNIPCSELSFLQSRFSHVFMLYLFCTLSRDSSMYNNRCEAIQNLILTFVIMVCTQL